MELRRAAGVLLRSPSFMSCKSSSILRIHPGYLHSVTPIERQGLTPLFPGRYFGTSSPILSQSASNSGWNTHSGPDQSSPKDSHVELESKTASQASPSNDTKGPSDTSRYTENERYNSLFDSIIAPPPLKSSADTPSYDRSTFGSNFSRPGASEHKDIMSLLQSAARNANPKPAQNATASTYESLIPPPGLENTPPREYPALGPSLGRSVEINMGKGVDLAKGLRRLDIILAQNRVRSDFNRQRFHERPGLKRKRLKSERWRKRFKEGFKYLTARVNKLRQQGW